MLCGMSAHVPTSTGFTNGDVSHWYRAGGVPTPGRRLDGPLAADVVIIGAGYTGLWTAYYLKKAAPSLHVVVLEQEFAGFGASGRNGGWLTADMAGSPRRYARTHGTAAVLALQREMFASVDEVIAVCAAEGIDADVVKSGVLTVARTGVQAARLYAAVKEAHSWGYAADDLRLLKSAEQRSRLRVAGTVRASWSPHCARVQPAKLVRGLARVVRELGVDLYEGTPVLALSPHRAVTPYGAVTGDFVIRATEGFTARLPGLRRQWLPMNSSMIVTEPLPDAFWAEVGWDGAELLGDMSHYYMYAQRTEDGRIAFGGRGRPYLYGSRVDARGGTHEWTVEALWRLLVDFFPAAASSSVAHAWSGVLGVPRDWCATVHVDPATGLGWAGGYTGHGVTTANLAGRTLRDLILGRPSELTELPWVGRRVRAWEPEPLRWLGVHAMYRLYRAADARERFTRCPSSLARFADLITGR